jgi:hypothetical protein
MYVYGQSEPVRARARGLLEDLEDAEHVPNVIRRAADLPDVIPLSRIRNLLSSIAEAERIGRVVPEKARYRLATGLRGPLDEVMDDIAGHTGMGAAAVPALRTARAATARMHEAAPIGSAVYEDLVGPEPMANAQMALDRILASDRPLDDIRRLRGLISGTARDVWLRRAAIVHILQRRVGTQAAEVGVSPQTSGAAAGKASAQQEGLIQILGQRGYDHLIGLLDDASGAARDGLKFSPRMPKGHGMNITQALLVAAGAIGSGGGAIAGSGMSTGIGVSLAVGTLLVRFAQRNGREAVANLALAALTDPDVYRMVQRAGATGTIEEAIEMLSAAAVRRGLMTREEVGRVEE